MNIFETSFDDEVIKQLSLREKILKGTESSQRPEHYLQYVTNKNAFIRLTSGVDVIDPKLRSYFNIQAQDDLATKYILEGGTLNSISNQDNTSILSAMRNNFNSIYNNLTNSSDFGLRPMPGIENLSIKSYGDRIATLRIATINLICYNIQQLEALEVLYMRPGFRVLLEWGHTIYFKEGEITPQQTKERLEVIKKNKTKKIIQEKINSGQLKTNFNYDALLGKVRNFSWESEVNGTYRCTVELIGLGDIIDSLKISIPSIYNQNETDIDTDKKSDTLNKNNIFFSVLDLIKKEGNASWENISKLKFNSLYSSLKLKTKNREEQELKILKIDSTTDNVTFTYIRLQDLIKLVNDLLIFKEGEEPSVIIDEYLNLCLSHPYQISGDPYCCLIEPSNLTSTTKYGGDLNEILTKEYPYKDITEKQEVSVYAFKGNTNEILVEVNYVSRILEELIKEEKNEYSIYLKDFIQTLLDSISYSIGYINDFQIIISPENDFKYQIVDVNYIQAKIKKIDRYYTIPLMGVGENNKGGTYVRNYKLSTQLTNNISTTVSIAASADQNKFNIDGYKTSIYNVFNQGIKDRLTQTINSSVNNSNNINNQKFDVLTIASATKELLDKITDKDISLTGINSSDLKIHIKDLINYSNSVSPESNFSFGCYTPVPLKLSLTMDGISGLKIGQIFTIPASRLPFQYKIFDETYYGPGTLGKPRVAFIIFGIDHSISINEGWATSLNCQMVMLNPDIIGYDILNILSPVNVKPAKFKKEFRYVREMADNEIHFVLYEEENITLDYYMKNLPNSGQFNNKPVSYYKEQFNGTWTGYKPQVIDGYIILGKYSQNATNNVLIYFPYNFGGGRTNISDFKLTEIKNKNITVFKNYDSYISKNLTNYENIPINNGTGLWYGSGPELVSSVPIQDSNSIYTPNPNYQPIQPLFDTGKI